MSFLTVKNLSFAYDEKLTLSNLSFDISEGESFGIIGPNGSGKTTLLRAMSGTIPSQGELYLSKKPLNKYSRRNLARFLAFMEQEGTPPLAYTVEEVASMGRYPWLRPFGDISEEEHHLIEKTLKLLDIWELRNKKISALSGGERQLVSLARAMIQEPKVLFLDEPTTYLDIGHQLLVMKHIRKWQTEKKLTVVMVLHDLNLAAQFCDSLLLLNKGRIQSLGPVHEVIREDNLELVYKTKPIVIEHPISNLPQILLG